MTFHGKQLRKAPSAAQVTPPPPVVITVPMIQAGADVLYANLKNSDPQACFQLSFEMIYAALNHATVN